MKPKYSQKLNDAVIQETAESVLIVAALGDISAGTHASADFFNKSLPKEHPARISRQTVWHWANGSKRVSDARLRFWKAFFPNGDTRHALAIAIESYREREASVAHWVGNVPDSEPVLVVKQAKAGSEAGTSSKKKTRMRLGRDF